MGRLRHPPFSRRAGWDDAAVAPAEASSDILLQMGPPVPAVKAGRRFRHARMAYAAAGVARMSAGNGQTVEHLALPSLSLFGRDVLAGGRQRDVHPAVNERHRGLMWRRHCWVVGVLSSKNDEAGQDVRIVVGVLRRAPRRRGVADDSSGRGHAQLYLGELVQDQGLSRGSDWQPCPGPALDVLLLRRGAVEKPQPEFLQTQRPAFEAPALGAVVANASQGAGGYAYANPRCVDVMGRLSEGPDGHCGLELARHPLELMM
ncbi:hypothetical protein Emed_007223 [Eimeria media]